MKILLIDDSVDMGHLVTLALSPYKVDQALTLAMASEKLAAEVYDLMLIDVSLPDGDGFKFCDELVRGGRFDETPKVFLTAHGQVSEKVFGLNCGADDYITKPFAIAELRARVDSRLRRRKAVANTLNRIHCFEFDSDFQKCFLIDAENKTDLGLTPTEYRILLVLARLEGKPLSRGEIVRAVWTAHGMNIEERGVDTHVAHLRKKLLSRGPWLISVYGKGYAFQAPSASQSQAA
jgi:DNA-binding response OmpR family regulator